MDTIEQFVKEAIQALKNLKLELLGDWFIKQDEAAQELDRLLKLAGFVSKEDFYP